METIGEKFKTARQNSGWTLDDVTRRTKISINILEAIENNDFRKLPSPTYAIGFIRNYAKLLGINDKEIVSEFIQQDKEASGTHLDLRDDLVAYEQDKKRSGYIWAGVIILVLVVGGYYLLKKFPSSKSKEDIKKESVAEDEKKKSSEVSLIGRYQKMMMDKKSPVHVPRTEVTVKIIKEVFVSVSEGDNLLFSGVLKEGSSETWQAEGAISLKVGAPNSVHVLVGGQDKGIVSEEWASPHVIIIEEDGLKVSLPESTPDE